MIYTQDDINPFLDFDEQLKMLVGRNGEYTVGYKLELPPIFTVAEEVYDEFVETFTKAVQILPNWCRIHRQDFIFNENSILEPQSGSFYEQEYIKMFASRSTLCQESYIYFTLIPKIYHDVSISTANTFKAKGFIHISKKEAIDFKEKIEQFIAIVTSVVNQNEEGQPAYIKFINLEPQDFLSSKGVIAKYLTLGEKQFSDIEYNKDSSSLKVGDNTVELFSLSSLTTIPAEVQSIRTFPVFDLPACWSAFIGPILRFPHIVNSYIIKGDTEKEKDILDRKKNFLNSLASVARSNLAGAEEIEEFLNYADENKSSIIDLHINILIWDRNEKELAIKRQALSAMLSQLNCITPKAEVYNKFNLFIASLPGNEVNLFSEYRFKTLDMIGVMMTMNFDGLPPANTKNGLRVIDRLSKTPLRIDISEPYSKYNLNKNKFIFGGSGSGKSFNTNHALNSALERGAHVMIVDLGRSYEGLCSVYNGKWFEYTKEKPLSFNPFILSKYDISSTGNIDEEKRQALTGIIKVLWKGVEGNFDQTENVIIDKLISAYYKENLIRKFDTFYEFAKDTYEFPENIGFDKDAFLFVLERYYKTGEYPKLLNGDVDQTLVKEELVIIELDNIRKNPILLSVTTAVIMDVFVTKMRNVLDAEKIIVFEEAWSALSNAEMAAYMQWLAKTARKYNAEINIVTQELDDIIKSGAVGQSLIANCSTRILLDQSNFKKNFDYIQKTLGLSDYEKQQVLSINKGKEAGDKSKDFFVQFVYGKSYVVQLSVSKAEAFCYSSAQEEKAAIRLVADKFGISYSEAIQYIIKNLITDINRIQKQTGKDLLKAVQSLIQ